MISVTPELAKELNKEYKIKAQTLNEISAYRNMINDSLESAQQSIALKADDNYHLQRAMAQIEAAKDTLDVIMGKLPNIMP